MDNLSSISTSFPSNDNLNPENINPNTTDNNTIINSNVSSPQQSATSSITESPESFESSTTPTITSDNINNIDMNEYIDSLSLILDNEQKRQSIVNKLYELIEAVEPYLVAKITGMIIHKQSSDKLIKLLLNNKLLQTKISQATDILLKHNKLDVNNNYAILYNDINNCHSTKEKLNYLRNKLYPKVKAYVLQKNLADIITDMLLQLNISEIFVLLNQTNTLKTRMNEAIKAYLEANAVHIHAINEFKNQ